jgi:hypothetical protein
LAQHRVEQAGPDFSASIFDHSKTIAEIERAVATLAALLVEPDGNTTPAAEPPQPAQQLISGHALSNKTVPRYRQASNWTFLSEQRRLGR